MSDFVPTSETLLTIAQATRRVPIPVTEKTVRRWCASGKLPTRRQGGRLVIAASDLDQFLARR